MIKKFGLLKVLLFGVGAFLVLDVTARLGIRIAVASLAVYVFLCFIKTIKESLFSGEKKSIKKELHVEAQEKSEREDIIREELENNINLSKKVSKKEKVHS